MSIRALFLKAVQYPEPVAAGSREMTRKSYRTIEDFFQHEASREVRTLRYGSRTFRFWLAGIRPINFVVEYDGKEEIVGFVAD